MKKYTFMQALGIFQAIQNMDLKTFQKMYDASNIPSHTDYVTGKWYSKNRNIHLYLASLTDDNLDFVVDYVAKLLNYNV